MREVLAYLRFYHLSTCLAQYKPTLVFTCQNFSLNVLEKSFFCEDSVHIWIWILMCQPSETQTKSLDPIRCKHLSLWQNILFLAWKQNTVCLVSLIPVFLPFWNCLIHQAESAALCIASCSAKKCNTEHDNLQVNIIISSIVFLVAYKYIFVTT